MATTKQLQEENIRRQTGIEIEPPPIMKMDRSGKYNPEPYPIDANLVSAEDLLGQVNTSNMNYAREAMLSGWGDSRYDTRSGFVPGADLEDIRAREQSWGSKVLNGTLKGALTLGTTYANTTAGFLAGISEALYGFTPAAQLFSGHSIIPFSRNQEFPKIKDAIQQGVNNEVSQSLIRLQKLGEEWFPNFRTVQERSEEYQRNWLRPSFLFSGNTIGDLFIKNFGFTAGAMLGAGTWSKLLGRGAASELAKDTMKGVAVAAEGDVEAVAGMKGAAQAIQRGGVVANGTAIAKNLENAARRATYYPFWKQVQFGLISAMGEGNAEGLMARDEYLEEALPELEAWFSEKSAALEKKVINMHEDNREKVYIANERGEYDPDYVLSETGERVLVAQKNELYKEYRERRDYIMKQADELAAVTFGLNIPILTVSNIVQFGRILGGGWKSARKAAGAAAGRMTFDAAGNPVAKYNEKNIVRSVARTAAGVTRMAGSEAAEEMMQGFVSSGAKNVASDKLTMYNDYGYDRKTLDVFRRDWFESMMTGGEEYLRDKKNWQEGFLGALTGLLGMPGRGYFSGQRGGLAEAIVEANQDIRNWNSAAAKLNQLVNSTDFQDRWKGYIRHLAFNDNIQDAVKRDDEYIFHWADDAQLFNDVMSFAKAGRLDDLMRVADRFSDLSKDDVRDVRELRKQNGAKPDQLLDSAIKKSVEDQAKKIKKTIEDYGNIREQLLARLPVGASDEIIDETVFTGLQIRSAEERFLSLLNETMDSLDGILEANTNKKKSAEESRSEIEELKRKYTKIFAGSLVSLDKATRERDEKTIGELKSMVSNDPILKAKVDDIHKLYLDRQRFFDKLTTLQRTTNEEFAAQAMNQEKVQQQAEKQEAMDEAAGMTSFAAVRDAYNKEFKANLGDASAFIERMQKVRKNNEYVDSFLKTIEARSNIRAGLKSKYGTIDKLPYQIVDSIFDAATSEKDMLNPLSVLSYDAYIAAKERQAGGKMDNFLEVQAELSAITGELYNAAADKVIDVINNINQISESVSGRDPDSASRGDVRSETSSSEDDGKEPSNPSTVVREPDKSGKAFIAEDGKSATDKKGQVWEVGEIVYGWDATKENPQPIQMIVVGFESERNDIKMIANDGKRDRRISLNHQLPFIHKYMPENNGLGGQAADGSDVAFSNPTSMDEVAQEAAETYVPPTSNEVKEDQRKDSNGNRMYYQTAIPEFPVHYARELRGAKGIDARMAVMKKIKDTPTEAPALKDIYEYLSSDSKQAYRNTVKELKEGDKISFITPADLPLHNGNPQIVMALERDGKTFYLNMMRTSGEYHNLDKFWEAYIKEYNIRHIPNQDFKFSKQSTVRTKRGGVIVYDYSPDYSGEKKLTEIPEYDPNAPIVWFNRTGQIESLRGDSKAGSSVYSWRSMSRTERNEHRGRFYYMADDGLGGYSPVRLNIEHFKPNNMNSDLIAIKNVRDKLDDVASIAKDYFASVGQQDSQGRIASMNRSLQEVNTELKQLLNLGRKSFALSLNETGPVLRLINTDKKGNQFDSFALNPANIDKLVESVAREQMSFNLKPENIASFIDQGLITSNAKKLLPENVDFYIEPWDENDFFKPASEPDNTSQVGFDDSALDGLFESAEPDDDIDFGNDFMADSVGEIDGSVLDEVESAPEELPEEGESAWDALSDNIKENLGNVGITKEAFDDMSPEDQEHWVECAGA